MWLFLCPGRRSSSLPLQVCINVRVEVYKRRSDEKQTIYRTFEPASPSSLYYPWRIARNEPAVIETQGHVQLSLRSSPQAFGIWLHAISFLLGTVPLYQTVAASY